MSITFLGKQLQIVLSKMSGIYVTSERLSSIRWPRLNTSNDYNFISTNEISTKATSKTCVGDQRPYRVASLITAQVALLVEVYILICLLLRR